ncbi:SOS response-associated peptidase [Occallatibacter riparius]|uniref:SOS response-associated peptidase n=1 Tax=Occallatibacter riparius TaxID=1002689 RepID=A0A9J7BRJ2_9BACT|nr:SOS response-associated peptidase [Occallatibacter riparius]UWZ85288.1 SOS response-associated peptidase [Occallatibacter riparius]
MKLRRFNGFNLCIDVHGFCRAFQFDRYHSVTRSRCAVWPRWAGIYTIVTTDPNELMELLHNSMPVILLPEEYQRWLDPGNIAPNC